MFRADISSAARKEHEQIGLWFGLQTIVVGWLGDCSGTRFDATQAELGYCPWLLAVSL